MTYEPADDTYLLLQSVKNDLQQHYLNQILNICEVGCGSGEIITTLAQEFSNHSYSATDINSQAIEDTQQLAKEKKVTITTKEGSFLEPFLHQQFDIILFNTPYLPCEEGDRFYKLSIEDKSIYGGQCGYEVTCQFLDELLDSIHEHSVVYMLISTLTQPNIVEEVIRGNGLDFEIINNQKLFFEQLLVYKIYPSSLLFHLMSSQYITIKRFDKGRHSYILQAQHPLEENLAIIKYGKQQHIEKELKFLQKLQDTNYAPHIIDYSKEYILYNKIEGITIEEFFRGVKQQQFSREDVEIIINRCFQICFDLDIRGICKDEMTHPNEHIFIDPLNKEKIYFIDFERSVFSKKRSNSTQFLQFILRNSQIFKTRHIKISKEKCIAVGREIMLRNSSITLKEIVC